MNRPFAVEKKDRRWCGWRDSNPHGLMPTST